MNSSNKVPEKQILYQAPHLTISHFPGYSTLYYQLKGYLEEEAARDFFDKTLYFVNQTNSSSLLADLTRFKGGPQNLASYVNQVFSQKLSDSGIERLGMNKPLSGFGEFTNRIAAGESARLFLEVKEYTALEEALQWIKQEKNKG